MEGSSPPSGFRGVFRAAKVGHEFSQGGYPQKARTVRVGCRSCHGTVSIFPHSVIVSAGIAARNLLTLIYLFW